MKKNNICEKCMFLNIEIKMFNRCKRYCIYPDKKIKIKNNINEYDFYLPRK